MVWLLLIVGLALVAVVVKWRREYGERFVPEQRTEVVSEDVQPLVDSAHPRPRREGKKDRTLPPAPVPLEEACRDADNNRYPEVETPDPTPGRDRENAPEKGPASPVRRRPGSIRARRPIPPEKRGGRPREPEKTSIASEDGQRPDIPPRQALVELVCKRDRNAWLIGFERNEDLESDSLTMSVGDNTLREDHGFYALPTISQPVSASLASAEDYFTAWPGTKGPDPLVFRLDASGQKGRYVKRPTTGFVLVVAPSDLTPHEQATVVAGPEQVLIEEGWRAYAMDLGDGARLSFTDPRGALVSIAAGAAGVRLEGITFPDGSERMGPLFAPDPPTLAGEDAAVWDDIATVVIGEEGPGEGRWRTSFRPQRGVAEQVLPEEVFRRQGGWYYVRLYNREAELLDSLDFRFAGILPDTGSLTPAALPTASGYLPLSVGFEVGHGWNVRLENPGDRDIEIRRVELDGGVHVDLVFGRDPAADLTRWELTGPEGRPSVPFTIRLDRIWWTVEETDAGEAWTDVSLRGYRRWFGVTSSAALIVKAPGRRKLWAGFWQECKREFPVSSDRSVIPLKEFGEAPAVRAHHPSQFRVWLDRVHCVACIDLPGGVLRCTKCGSIVPPGLSRLEEHLTRHLDEYYVSLTWSELVAAFPERKLPQAIYQCTHDCPKYPNSAERCYVRADDVSRSATSAIYTKQEKCPHCPRVDGLMVPKFRPVSDPAEARRAVRGLAVPDVVRCTLCPPGARPLESHDRSKRIAHLIEDHHEDLVSFEEVWPE